MAATWVLHRFRSAFVQGNLALIVLRLLVDSEMSEWEVMNALYDRYGSSPTSKEFRRLVDELLEGAYATTVEVEETRKLRISNQGRRLFQRLEDEYRQVVSSLGEGSVHP